MPGIYGWSGRPEAPDATLRFGAMAERLRHHPWYVEHGHVDPAVGLALGRTSLGVIDPAEQPARNEDDAVLADSDVDVPVTPEVREPEPVGKSS